MNMITAIVATWLNAMSPATGVIESQTKAFERLEGFDGLIGKAIAAVIGDGGVIQDEGYPLEPGIYVTLGLNNLGIFDQVYPVLSGGLPRETAQAPSCRVACPIAIHQAFVAAYRKLSNEMDAIGTDIPPRLLFTSGPDVPATTLISTIYTAMQSWPKAVPPHAFLVVQNSVGNLVGKPIHILPPQGVVVQSGTAVLGLRVTVAPGESYTLSAIEPTFGADIEVQGVDAMRVALEKLKKRYPNKDAVIIQAAEDLSAQAYLKAMRLVAPVFSKMIVGRADIGLLGR